MSFAALALLLSPAALAVDVYINGVLVTGLENKTLSGVSVTFDAAGDVRIDAPNVTIGRSSTPTPQTTAEPAPETSSPPTSVPPGRWWLVAEDPGSVGVQVDVRVNGELVQVVASGGPQVLVDLAPYLHRGPNQVTLTARAQGKVGSKPLSVYVGTGSTTTGVLELGSPEIRFAPDRDSVRQGVTQVYTLTVD